MILHDLLSGVKRLEDDVEKAWDNLIGDYPESRHHRHHHHKHFPKIRQVLTVFINNQTFIIMSLTVEQTLQAPIVLALVDAGTLAPITATKANEKEVSDNPAVAAVDALGNLQGVAPGSFNLISDADWTYTDANTGLLVTSHETTTTPGTVTAVVVAEKVLQVVSLGKAVAIAPKV